MANYCNTTIRPKRSVSAWKNYNDYFNTIDFAKAEGRAEGEQKKNLENAKKMKEMGLSSDIIMQVTGLPIEELENL